MSNRIALAPHPAAAAAASINAPSAAASCAGPMATTAHVGTPVAAALEIAASRDLPRASGAACSEAAREDELAARRDEPRRVRVELLGDALDEPRRERSRAEQAGDEHGPRRDVGRVERHLDRGARERGGAERHAEPVQRARQRLARGGAQHVGAGADLVVIEIREVGRVIAHLRAELRRLPHVDPARAEPCERITAQEQRAPAREARE